MITFEKSIAEAKCYNPRNNFELDSQIIENRIDPLVGYSTVVRTGRKEWQWQYKTDEKLINQIVKDTRERCFFCPEKVSQYTPKFPEEIFLEGRAFLGEACLFPNLFAQKEHSAIVVISKSHYLRLDQFKPEILADAFKLSLSYIRRIHEVKSVKYAEIGCNYLFPAGASLPHPHLQVLGSSTPYYLLKELLEHGKEYYEANSANYWEELIEMEKKEKVRYLGTIGNSEWYVPFAPMREDEVHALIRNKSNFLEFTDSELMDLAEGLSRVLRFYGEKGLSSFNFALYSGPLGEKLDYFWAGLRVVSRTSVQSCPVNDVWFSADILLDGFVTEPPEEVANSLRRFF